MREYGKVHTSFWTSKTIRDLSETGRTLAFYLLTCPHSTIAGVFRVPDGYVCEDLQWDAGRVAEGFAELFDKGFANRCETTKWVWVIKHFEWNQPENPNQRKSARKVAQSVPNECAWKPLFIKAVAEILEIEVPQDSNPCETVQKPFLNQEQEQEQEHINHTNPNGLVVVSRADNTPPCPHQEIIALYHQILPTSPAIRDWTPARQDHLRTRWKEDKERQNLEWWKRFFEYIATSSFLTGKATSAGRKPFCPGLEWICKAENFAKIREGRYEDMAA